MILCVADKEYWSEIMSNKKLLTNGNAFKRTDGRWGGVVWYMDEAGERKQKAFSGTTKAEVNRKMTEYITKFEEDLKASNESNQTIKDNMQTWLEVFKYPSIERTTYDRLECTAKNRIYTEIGNRVISRIKAVDIKKILNSRMQQGYAYTTVKKIHNLLNEYFRYLTEQEIIDKNPMKSVPMIKKHNFMASQGNYTRPTNFRKRFYKILKGADIEIKGLHALRHTFATKLVNGIKQPDGSIKSLTPRQVANILGHSTSEITERYYVKKDTTHLNGITDEFEM